MDKNWSRMCGTSCNLSRVDLEITHESYEDSIKFLYTIKNTGTAAICGPVYIESSLMGKLCFDEIVLPVHGDTATVSAVYQGMIHDGKEEARAYVKLGNSWIYSEKETDFANFKRVILKAVSTKFNPAVFEPKYGLYLFVNNMSQELARNVKVTLYDSTGILDFNTIEVYDMYNPSTVPVTRVPYTDFVIKDNHTAIINLHDINGLDISKKIFTVATFNQNVSAIPSSGFNVYTTADNFDKGTSGSFFVSI